MSHRLYRTPKSIRDVTNIKADDRFYIENEGMDVIILKRLDGFDKPILREDAQ